MLYFLDVVISTQTNLFSLSKDWKGRESLIVKVINLNKCGQTTIMFLVLVSFRIRALNYAHTI